MIILLCIRRFLLRIHAPKKKLMTTRYALNCYALLVGYTCIMIALKYKINK
jgi:hypothetical protein